MKIVEETPYRFRIEQEGAMRVPGIVFASRSLLPRDEGDMALMQVVNVATLPGIVRASYAMPDVHWGYGFPIGGVAATDVDNDGVVSPGGVGFDISCGVRLLVGEGLDREELQPRKRARCLSSRPPCRICAYARRSAPLAERGIYPITTIGRGVGQNSFRPTRARLALTTARWPSGGLLCPWYGVCTEVSRATAQCEPPSCHRAPRARHR